MSLEAIRQLGERLKQQIGTVVVGQERTVDFLLISLLVQGNVLLEGVPGTAKTLLARAFAACLSLKFGRIQFTPDLLPGDVLGSNLFNFQSNEFTLTKGPIFTEILLADEINRTPPKTQAALLEAMQERAVTIDGVRHELGEAFMIVATQNPIEHEGTYPLPEAQLDRFLFKVRVGYPDREQELELVRVHGHHGSLSGPVRLDFAPVADLATLRAARAVLAEQRLSDEIIAYVVDMVRATRQHPSLLCGASPRAAHMLAVAARARAALDGRDYVIPDDVKELLRPCLGHRLVVAPGAEIEGATVEDILGQVIDQVAAPR